MHVLSTWSAPTAVYHSHKLGETRLVIAKAARIEVLRVAHDGLQHICGIDLWGQITSLNVLEDDNLILATTDHPRPMAFLLAYSVETSILRVLKSASLYSRSDRIVEIYQGAVVHRQTKIAVSMAYKGSAKVLSLALKENKTSFNEFDCRLPELNIIDLCFLHISTPTVAILHTDARKQRHVLTRHVDLVEKELALDDLQLIPADCSSVQLGACMLIALEGSVDELFFGGLLVLGGGECKYIAFSSPSIVPRSPKQRKDKAPFIPDKRKRARNNSSTSSSTLAFTVPLPFLDPTTYEFIDKSRILLADVWGRLHLLVISQSSDDTSVGVTGIKCIPLGEISSPTSLTYLDRGIIYVGSHFGDSQLVRLLASSEVGPDSAESHVEVLDVYQNVAPIHNAVVSKAEGSTQVILCSGGFNSGSLRIMRKSAEFKENAVIEQLDHVQTMWPLKMRHEDSYDRLLVVSSLYDTQIIELSEEISLSKTQLSAMDSSELPAFNFAQPTIAVCTLKMEGWLAIVQVTSTAVHVIDLVAGTLLSSWPTEGRKDVKRGEIVCASANATQVLVAFKGGKLVYLTFDKELQIIESQVRKFINPEHEPMEICALTVSPMWADFPYESVVAACAFWGSSHVLLLEIPSLKTVPELNFTPSETHIPRSLLLHTFGDVAPYLLVGLADGTLVAYELQPNTFHSKSKRVLSFGSLPLRLSACRYGNRSVVFVSGSRPAVIFLENGRMRNSAIGVKEVAEACILHSAAFPDSLVLSRGSQLHIGQIQQLHDLQIRTIHFGADCPQSIALDIESHIYGIITIRDYPPVIGEDSRPSTSSFQLLDDLTFQPIANYNLEFDEEARCLASLVIECDGSNENYWVVGTEVMAEQPQGRLYLFTLSAGTVKCVASHILSGSVDSVAAVSGRIIAAAGPGVTVLELSTTEMDRGVALKALHKWERSYHINQVRVDGDMIYTSDSLRSLDVLRWTPSGKLQLVARDHSSLWPVAMDLLAPREIFVAEGKGHILSFTIKKDNSGLERAGAYYLGELVTGSQQGGIIPDEVSGDVRPSVVLFTNTGRIIVMSAIEQDYALLLTALERNLSLSTKGPGGLSHEAMRAPVAMDSHNETAKTGFIDGDFVETFLQFKNADSAQKTLDGNNAAQTITGYNYESVLRALEQLQLVH